MFSVVVLTLEIVALKVVDSGIVCSGTIPFENEIKSLNVMQSHPHIVSIVHSGWTTPFSSFNAQTLKCKKLLLFPFVEFLVLASPVKVRDSLHFYFSAKDIDTEMQALEAELFSSVLSSSDDAIGLSNEQ